MTVSLKLHYLTVSQQRIIDGKKRYNIVSGGVQSGRSTIADDIVLTAAYEPEARVAYCFPDEQRLRDARRRLIKKILTGVQDARSLKEIKLRNGAKIALLALNETGFDIINTLGTIVVDDAADVVGFYDMWEDKILPYVGNEGWVFSKPKGANNGFGRLYRQSKFDKDWQAVQLPSMARCDGFAESVPAEIVKERKPGAEAALAVIQKAHAELDEMTFMQEYEGVVLDQGIELTLGQTIIGEDETFLDWCDRLAADGLVVDEHPFRLDDRPTMRWVYGQVPSTVEEAFGQQLVLMKCTQVGFTVMEMLAMLYLAIKFMPCKVGMYMPDQNLASMKSSERFMPIVRTVPDAYKLMLENPTGTRKTGEGNVMVRNMGRSRFHFLWTSGKGATESVPLDVVSFDEVQEMAIADMEKTKERMSASNFRFTLMGSTANWPDRDIHFWYKKGTQHQFWTLCPSCGEHQVLDDHFPECVRMREGVDIVGGAPVTRTDYRYVCHACDGVIPDSQQGEWRPSNPDAPFKSIHYPQFLSPTISPREMIEAYFNADDMKNFFNRKRGKPYVDPSQMPVTLEMLNECAEEGKRLGVEWKRNAKGTFMGIDQMGQFNVALIAERLPSGHMAIIHAEEIYHEDPFARCSELIAQYGVTVCVVETLPNYNDAKRFANAHPGKVFLAHYANMKDDMMRWGDAVPNSAERKTSEEDRDRYTVQLDQYKCMQVALKRIQSKVCVFADPMGLVQEIREKGAKRLAPILKEQVFLHFTRTALVAVQDDEQKLFKRKVVKVGIDPHFSYAFMLLNVAWARSHGTTMFLSVDDTPREKVVDEIERHMPGLPSKVMDMIQLVGDVCGLCSAYEDGRCTERGLLIEADDPSCPMFIQSEA